VDQSNTGADPLPPEIDDGKHVMILKFMDDGWADSLTDLEAPIQMPYFVGGEAFERMEQKQGVTLDSYMLICGILAAWFEPDKYCMDGSSDKLREFLLVVLEDIRRVYEADSLEQLILDVASKVRADHGSLPASRILTAGCDIFPENSFIHSDLIMDVWFILEHTKQVDRSSALETIMNAFSWLDMDALDAGLVEVLDYIYMVSLSFLGRNEECNQYFWQTASKRCQNPKLKIHMVGLSEGRVEDFDYYRIWDDVVS